MLTIIILAAVFAPIIGLGIVLGLIGRSAVQGAAKRRTIRKALALGARIDALQVHDETMASLNRSAQYWERRAHQAKNGCDCWI